MEWRWQWRLAQHASAASRLNHGDVFKPVKLIECADAPVEIDEIGAAAEEQVLAVVDNLACAGMFVGRRATADVCAAFDEAHIMAGIGECLRGCEAGDACSYYCD